jgi:hypothetical protein
MMTAILITIYDIPSLIVPPHTTIVDPNSTPHIPVLAVGIFTDGSYSEYYIYIYYLYSEGVTYSNPKAMEELIVTKLVGKLLFSLIRNNHQEYSNNNHHQHRHHHHHHDKNNSTIRYIHHKPELLEL